MLTFFRLASDNVCGVAFPLSLSRPSGRQEDLRLVISVSISAEPLLRQLKPADRLATSPASGVVTASS